MIKDKYIAKSFYMGILDNDFLLAHLKFYLIIDSVLIGVFRTPVTLPYWN